jgi:hypothetical protein
MDPELGTDTVGACEVGTFCPAYSRATWVALGPEPEVSNSSRQNGMPASTKACCGGQVLMGSPLDLKAASDATVLEVVSRPLGGAEAVLAQLKVRVSPVEVAVATFDRVKVPDPAPPVTVVPVGMPDPMTVIPETPTVGGKAAGTDEAVVLTVLTPFVTATSVTVAVSQTCLPKPAVPVSTSAAPLPTAPVQLKPGPAMMVRAVPPAASIALEPMKMVPPEELTFVRRALAGPLAPS